MNIINLILVLILLSLNFQYYHLNEESKILKETILELKDQNQNLSNEINKLSIINTNNSYATNSTLNSILYFGGIVLVAGIAFYFLNGYLFDTSTQSLEASKIINQTTSGYTNNLMNQIHSQNLSQINWLDKKFDSLVTIIQKANIFNNHWFIENVMPNLSPNGPSLPQAYNLNQTFSGVDLSPVSSYSSDCLTQFAPPAPYSDSFQNMINLKTNTFSLTEKVIKEQIAQKDILKVMEKTLETAEWI